MHTTTSDAEFQRPEEETLNQELHCGECGTLIRLTLDTPIGIGGYDGTTPIALCGTGCAKLNAERIAGGCARCTCGAIVAVTDMQLMASDGSIVGCPACEQEGQPLPKAITIHYWARKGGARCMPEPNPPTMGVVTSIRRGRVNCPACLQALIRDSELAGAAVRL
jgi:hypothetical protein